GLLMPLRLVVLCPSSVIHCPECLCSACHRRHTAAAAAAAAVAGRTRSWRRGEVDSHCGGGGVDNVVDGGRACPATTGARRKERCEERGERMYAGLRNL